MTLGRRFTAAFFLGHWKKATLLLGEQRVVHLSSSPSQVLSTEDQKTLPKKM